MEVANMNIRPIGNRVLIEALKVEEKTKSGILLPNNSNTAPSNTGVVIAIGNISEEIVVGDKIFYKTHSGIKTNDPSKELYILEVGDILAILD
jgi:chaperonin GroES